MLKALGRSAKGDNILVIGIAEENVERLREHDPIVFDPSELGESMDIDGLVCLAYVDADAVCKVPTFKEIEPTPNLILIPISDFALEELSRQPIGIQRDDLPFKIIIMRGVDEVSMERELKGSITHKTMVRRTGFPPGTFVSDN